MKKKIGLSRYHKDEFIEMEMDVYADRVKSEVKPWLRVQDLAGDIDKIKLEKAITGAPNVMIHLDTEKRIMKMLWVEANALLSTIENDALLISQKELSSKATAREHKIFVHETVGDEMGEIAAKRDRLEQRFKLLADHVDTIRRALSGNQSVLASMKVEWEVSST